MKHRDKLKLARRHMTQAEIKDHVSPFQSKWWEERKKGIERKVIKSKYNQSKHKITRKIKSDGISQLTERIK